MKKRKWLKRIIWSGCIVAVLVVSGLFAMNYAINRMLDSMADDALNGLLPDDLMADTGADELADQQESSDSSGDISRGDASSGTGAGDASDADPNVGGGMDLDAGPDTSVSSDADAGSGTGSGTSSNAGSGSSSEAGTGGGSSGNAQGGAVSEPNKGSGGVDGNTGTAGDAVDSDSYTPEISPDKAAEVKDDITIKEKTKVASVLLKRLKPSDIMLFTKLSQGGIDLDEKKEMKDVMLERLSEKEYDDLIAIAAKYGLSQGDNYEKSKQSE